MKLTENILRKLIIEAISQQQVPFIILDNASIKDITTFKSEESKPTDEDYLKKLININTGVAGSSEPYFQKLLGKYGTKWQRERIVPNPYGFGEDVTIKDAITMLKNKIETNKPQSSAAPVKNVNWKKPETSFFDKAKKFVGLAEEKTLELDIEELK